MTQQTTHKLSLEKQTVKNQKRLYIPTQDVCDFIERNEDVAALLEPVYLPMVVPPEPWTSPTGGGYLTHYTNRLSLVKTMNRHYLEELEDMTEEMAEVYEAINHIQSTPWTVNHLLLLYFKWHMNED